MYGIARSEQELSKLKSKFGDRFFYVVGDVTDEKAIKQLVDDAIKGHGKIDSIIANAGVLEPVQDVNNINTSAWRSLFEVNFFSIVSLVSSAIPYLIKSNGNLIFVSSGASIKPYNGLGAYGSSKAALNHLAMTISDECPGVKSISVAPGVVDTQMQVDIRDRLGPNSMSPETLKRFTDLKANTQLLDSSVPAAVYTKLALFGIPPELNGKYVRYNDERLSF